MGLCTLPFLVTGCISVSASTSLVNIPARIMSSATGLTICAIIPKIKKYMSVIKKNKKKHGEIILLAKAKLNRL